MILLTYQYFNFKKIKLSYSRTDTREYTMWIKIHLNTHNHGST